MINSGVSRDIYEDFTKWERENKIGYRDAINGLFAHGNGGIPLGILNLETLKNGSPGQRIEVNPSSLDRVKAYISKLREVPGIYVHDFKETEREVK